MLSFSNQYYNPGSPSPIEPRFSNPRLESSLLEKPEVSLLQTPPDDVGTSLASVIELWSGRLAQFVDASSGVIYTP